MSHIDLSYTTHSLQRECTNCNLCTREHRVAVIWTRLICTPPSLPTPMLTNRQKISRRAVKWHIYTDSNLIHPSEALIDFWFLPSVQTFRSADDFYPTAQHKLTLFVNFHTWVIIITIPSLWNNLLRVSPVCAGGVSALLQRRKGGLFSQRRFCLTHRYLTFALVLWLL